MKRYIVSLLHAMIMTIEFLHRIKRTSQKDVASTSLAMTLLSDILHLCYTHEIVMSKLTSRDTQQSVDLVFIGGMLRSSYNQIKTNLDVIANNCQEWRDDDFGSQIDSKGNKIDRGRIEDGVDKNAMVALQGQVTEMNKLLQSMALLQVNAAGSYETQKFLNLRNLLSLVKDKRNKIYGEKEVKIFGKMKVRV